MRRNFGRILTELMYLAAISIIPSIFLVSAALAVEYTYTTVDVPGADNTEVHGINNAGQIVGVYNNHGFLLSDGNYTTIDYPGADGTNISAINDTGQIVGRYSGSSASGSFLLSDGNLVPVECPIPGLMLVWGINNANQIVGGCSSHSFLLSGGNSTTIVYPGASGSTAAYGINNIGQIVGEYDPGNHGFLLSDGNYTTIDYPGAGLLTSPKGINDNGEIVGVYYTTYPYTSNYARGFLYSGGMFRAIDFPGATETWAFGINNAGQIVGAYWSASTGTHGFIATPVPPTLAISKSGSGTGTVISDPPGISCGVTCTTQSAAFNTGTQVSLAAAPSADSAFAYWTGACSGETNPCILTLTGDTTVTAHFVSDNTKKVTLKTSKVSKNGGKGNITSADGSISCGTGKECSEKYYPGTPVTLMAEALSGSTFAGWQLSSLNCPGTDPCTVTMDKAKTVKAVFVGDYSLTVHPLSRKKGTGVITSSPGSISCGTGNAGTCKEKFGYGAIVTLTAVGVDFTKWTGCPTPSGNTCALSMDKAHTVNAIFAGSSK